MVKMIVVFLPMCAITEVILVYEYLHGMPNSLENFAWGFRILYREFCMGIPNSL